MTRIAKLPPFLFGENRTALAGAGLIIHTVYPYTLGRVVIYKSHQELLESFILKNFLGSQVPGYNITIQYGGNLNQSKIPLSIDAVISLKAILKEMAQFYLDEKIFYKKSFYGKHATK